MCQSCWDKDKKVPLECNHSEWPVFNIAELKKTLENEARTTHKKDFNIYSNAIAEKPKGVLQWGFGSQILTVHFIT